MIQHILLFSFTLLLPFNLLLGRIIPETVLLPLYVIDILLLILGILLTIILLHHKRTQLKKSQKAVSFFLILFFSLGIITIFLNIPDILHFVEENDWKIVVHSMFKQIISDDPTQSINKTVQITLSLFLFLNITVSSLKKEVLLKISCIPLAFILLINLYLVINQQDVALDGGREGVTIHPYPITDFGRIYFPFVNTLLLSLYLSLFFFVLLFFFVHKMVRNIFGILLFLLLIVLGFTQGRIAILSCFILFLCLWFLLWKRFRISVPQRSFCLIAIILFFLVLYSFFPFSFSQFWTRELNLEDTSSTNQEITLEDASSLFVSKPLDKELEKKGRMSLHWPTALTLFSEAPILGIGTGMFYYNVVGPKNVVLQHQQLWPDTMRPTDVSSTAHSIYLQVLAEKGIIGFILFIAFLCCLLYFGYKKASTDHCSFFLFFSLITFLLQGIFFSYFEYREMVYLFFLFAALLLKKE